MRELSLRRKLKRAKPVFKRHEANKRQRLKNSSYRRPKGYTSAKKRNMRGRGKIPAHGYQSPLAVRGLHPSGLNILNVSSLKDLELVTKDSIIVISSRMGLKKKYELAKKLVDKKVRIANFDADKFIKASDELMKKRGLKRVELLKSRDKKKIVKKDDKKSEKKVEDLEVREGTKKSVYKKQKSIKGAEKEVVKGLK
jgi:large subunit ribosomal protein L32e